MRRTKRVKGRSQTNPDTKLRSIYFVFSQIRNPEKKEGMNKSKKYIEQYKLLQNLFNFFVIYIEEC